MSHVAALAIVAAASSPSDGCNYTWIGTAPLCDAAPTDCVSAHQEFVRYDRSGDGHTCITGEKVLCKSCPPSLGFLANWMGKLMPVLGNSSILDLSLPGTHDSMTFDLSSYVSDNANDMSPAYAWVLHEFGPLVKSVGVGSFIKTQAQTQGLSMRGQLEAGVRFVDFRVTHTAAPNKPSTSKKDWYSLHMVQSNNKALTYLQQAKDFLDNHPSEVLVLWISRHGSECAMGTDQYPNTTPAERQAFWQQIKAVFGGMLFDRESTSTMYQNSSSSSSSGSAGNSRGKATSQRLNETTIASMVAAGQRVVVYASDYADFTGNDTKAYDACTSLSNNLPDANIADLSSSVEAWEDTFRSAPAMQRETLANDQMLLISLAGSPPADSVKDAALLSYDAGIGKRKTTEKCARVFDIPNMTDWCPRTLLDCEQMRAYYLQSVLELIVQNETDDIGFPGAIYLDALDEGGIIRTGSTLLSRQVGQMGTAGRDTAGYAYVDTMLLYNVQKVCKSSLKLAAACTEHMAFIQRRRQLHPYQRWDDVEHGRLALWPNNSLPAS